MQACLELGRVPGGISPIPDVVRPIVDNRDKIEILP